MRTLSDEDATNRRPGADIEDFEQALDAFIANIRALQHAYFERNNEHLSPPVISVDPKGKKYLRIVQYNGSQHSVYCFVDKATGDILKADGWKRPAKHARGNIFVDAGKSAITPWGVHYIESRGHKN